MMRATGLWGRPPLCHRRRLLRRRPRLQAGKSRLRSFLRLANKPASKLARASNQNGHLTRKANQ